MLAISISMLVYTILMQKQQHKEAIAEKHSLMVETANNAARNERDLNDFIAHEVRNPISAALSACSFVSAGLTEVKLLMGVESVMRLQEDVLLIESGLKYADDLLHNMLDLNRIDTLEMQLHAIPTDIKRDILDPVASMIQRREDGATFEVNVTCPDDLVVSVDRLRLKQIVVNLARNSAKFVESGGFIRLRARLLSIVDFNGTGDGKVGNCVNVEDSGPGISDENGGKLLFARYHQTLQDVNQGARIGLSLCKKLVELMDGTTELDQSYDSGKPGMPGAKFDIRLFCGLIQSTMDVSIGTDENSTVSLLLPKSIGGLLKQ